MQSQSKPVAFNTRQIAFEMLALAGRALAVGVVVSVAAAILIVALVTFLP
jgi:hypothetical protein